MEKEILDLGISFLTLLKMLASVLVVVIGWFTGVFKKASNIFKHICYALFKKNINSINILYLNTPFSGVRNWWHMGKEGEADGMQISGEFQLSNDSDKDLILTGAEINKKLRGQVVVSGGYSKSSVPKKTVCNIRVDFWISPPIQKLGKNLKCNISVLDQRGQRYWIKNVNFRCISKKY